MKTVLFVLSFLLAPVSAHAQGCGPSNPQCIVTTAPPGTDNNQAASTAFVAGAVFGTVNSQTGNYSIAPADCGSTIQAGTGSSGFFTITVPAVTGFPVTCRVAIYNGDTTTFRGKALSSDPGCSSVAIVWPGQTCIIGIVNGAWVALSKPGRWRPLNFGTLINFYSDWTNGSDTIGATDGMASGVSAFHSAIHCYQVLFSAIDWENLPQLQTSCNLAPATTEGLALHLADHGLPGAGGGAALQFVGASLAISGAVTNGGLCKITVASGTSTYSANEIVSVYGVGGATGCNGTWKVTVTDSTHLTLQGTTFGGSYTSGGTVTNGSQITTNGDAFECFFGDVVELSNITWTPQSGNALFAEDGCRVYVEPGNIFGGTSANNLVGATLGARVELDGDIGIINGANQVVGISKGANFYAASALNINFLPGINPSYVNAFAVGNAGIADFGSITINLNGNTVTGTRCQAFSNGVVISVGGVPNTYFPGNANCTSATGGQVE